MTGLLTMLHVYWPSLNMVKLITPQNSRKYLYLYCTYTYTYMVHVITVSKQENMVKWRYLNVNSFNFNRLIIKSQLAQPKSV